MQRAAGLPVLSLICRSVESPTGLPAIDGIRVGHHTLTEPPTGCTMILFEKYATGRADDILRAVPEAAGLPNYPSVRDLTSK